MKPFKLSNRNQPFLLPPSIQDWLPKEHLARFIVEIVEQLDLSKIESQYSGKGKDAYHPQVMLSLLFYGYATGVFSSRKIERATYDSVAFRYISANTHPDHDTIANFRKRFLAELTDLFVQILSVAQEMGVLKVGKVSLDGTKVKASASKHKALSYAHAIKLQKQLEDEVQMLLQKAKNADNQEDNDGMNIPDEIARREDRLEVIKAAKVRIEQRANERHKQEYNVPICQDHLTQHSYFTHYATSSNSCFLNSKRYTTPRKPNNFTENLIPKRVKLDDKYRGYKDEQKKNGI